MDTDMKRRLAKFLGGGVLLLVLGGGLYFGDSCGAQARERARSIREGCIASSHLPGDLTFTKCLDGAKARCAAEPDGELEKCAKAFGDEMFRAP